MAQLNDKGRRQVKGGNFALSGRRFPIHDLEHGRKALQLGARAVKSGSITEAEYAQVKRAVFARYPTLKNNDTMNQRMRKSTGRSS